MKKKIIIISGLTGMLNEYFNNELKKIYNIIFFHYKNIKSKKKNIQVNFYNKNNLQKYINRYKPEFFIHSAGLTNVETCEKKKNYAKKVNYLLTKNIVEICLKNNIFLIFISTDHLFDGKNTAGYSESAKVNPLNQYAKTKVFSENFIKKKLKNYLIIRTNFFGKGNRYKKSFSDKIIYNLKKNKKIYLFDDVYFNPISMNYLVKIIFKLYKKKYTGVYNIGTEKKISKFKFGVEIAKIKKFNKDLVYKKSLDEFNLTRRPKNMFLKINKIKKIIKFNSKLSESLKYI